MFGEITTKLFEQINERFWRSSIQASILAFETDGQPRKPCAGPAHALKAIPIDKGHPKGFNP